MRDPSKGRNYSPEKAAFRRDHERRRRHGLVRRHAEKLCRLHGCSSKCAEAGLHDQVERIPPLIWGAEFTLQRPPRPAANQVACDPAPDRELLDDRPAQENRPTTQETAVPDGKPSTPARRSPARRPRSATRARPVVRIDPAARNASAAPDENAGPGESDDLPGLARRDGSVEPGGATNRSRSPHEPGVAARGPGPAPTRVGCSRQRHPATSGLSAGGGPATVTAFRRRQAAAHVGSLPSASKIIENHPERPTEYSHRSKRRNARPPPSRSKSRMPRQTAERHFSKNG
jgi:hypothetical protein